MTDTYLPLLKGVIARLKAITAVTDVLSTRIYTDVPQNEVFPYAVISITSQDYSANDFSGMAHTIQANIYSRKNSPREIGVARSAIYEALNRLEDSVTLDVGNMAHLHFNGVSDVFKDSDGATWVGVIQFRAVIT